MFLIGLIEVSQVLPMSRTWCLLQEVDCAYRILKKEGSRQGGELGRVVPVILCPLEGGSASVSTEEPNSKRSRKIFLATPREDDMWWPAESVSFVVDTGVQKKMVNYGQLPQHTL